MHSLVRDHYNSEASSQQLRARSLSSPSFQWSILSHRESTKSLHFPVVFSSPSGDHWGRLISQIIEFAAEPCSGRRNPLMSIWASLGEWNWKRLWCWERLGARGEGDDPGWDGWMASLTRWTWVWVNSRRWLWKGRPGMLRFMDSQRVEHDWATELNWTELMFLNNIYNINWFSGALLKYLATNWWYGWLIKQPTSNVVIKLIKKYSHSY